MNPAVEGYAAAVLGELDVTGVPAVADELVAVVRSVTDHAELLSALTDTSIPGPARRAVLADVLEGKVSRPVLRISTYTAGAVQAQEVPAALSLVANRASQMADGASVRLHPPSYSEARQRVAGFAAALFDELTADQLSEIEDELFRFARIVDSTPPLRELLADRDAPVPVRQGVIHDLIGSKVQPATLRLVDYVVSGGRARDFVSTLDWLVEETARARGWRVARVRAGPELDETERRQLTETLGRLAGAPVDLQVTVDPALLAGVRVQIGDLQIDGTARGRLDRLREHMVSANWTDAGFGRLGRPGPSAGSGGSDNGEGAN